VSRQSKTLTEDDRVLWTLVAKSTTPLKKRKVTKDELPRPAPEDKMPAAAAMAKPPEAPPAAPKKLTVSPVLDRPTLTKLSRGRLPIEGRVDLHGMTQSEAYALLLSFLQRAQANDVRFVLIITGKGFSSGGDGVLRRQVPTWLSTPPFRTLVSSHDVSARHHGGEGALYVRLRRRT
jgi:DNA-nicking Smr family endonuclease